MQAITEVLALMSTVDPVVTTSVATGDQIDMYEFHEALFVAKNGLTSGGYFRMSIYGGEGSGTASAVITGASGASSTTTGGAIIIRVSAEDVAAQGYRYVWPYLYASGTTAIAVDVSGYGVRPRYGPADELDLATVDEIIT